jgi:hypothetical protein
MEPLLNREFRPCAIICTVCGRRTRLHGLDLAAQSGGMKLFVGEGFRGRITVPKRTKKS